MEKKKLFFKSTIAYALILVMALAYVISPVGSFVSKAADVTAQGGTFVYDNDLTKTADSLVGTLLGEGVTATGATKSGTVYTFKNGTADIGIDSGIVLDTSGCASGENDSDLAPLMSPYEYGGHTSSLVFDMVADGELLNFKYAFGSGEFDQAARFNDVFALFVSVNGGAYENIALITRDDGTKVPVSITNLRAGTSGTEMENGASTDLTTYTTHSLFTPKTIGIDVGSGQGGVNGISNVFTAQKKVNVGDNVRLKLVIADVSDTSVDSYVFIQGGSLSFEDPANPTKKKTNGTISGRDGGVDANTLKKNNASTTVQSGSAAQKAGKSVNDVIDVLTGKDTDAKKELIKSAEDVGSLKVKVENATPDSVTGTVNKTELLLASLTGQEMVDGITGNDNITLTLTVEEKKAGSVNDDVKSAIKSEAKKSVSSDAKLYYFTADLVLKKNSESALQITDVGSNKLDITFAVPTSVSGNGNTVKAIRSHEEADGSISTAVLENKGSTAGNYDVETSKLCTMAFAYVSASAGGDATAATVGGTGNSTTAKAPKTGETSALFIIFFAAAVLAAGGYVYRRRRA